MKTHRFTGRLTAALGLRLTAALGMSLSLFGTGCGEESLDPVPGAPAPEAPPPDPPPPPPPDPVPQKRSVINRDPFGNVAARNNLLWDGDFEWLSAFGDQYGWIEPPGNPTISNVVVGPDCISGVKCARLTKNQDVIGIGVGLASGNVIASVDLRFLPAEGAATPACSEVEAFLLDIASLGPEEPDIALLPAEESAQAGLCKLVSQPAEQKHKVYLYVRNRSNEPVILDNALVLPEADFSLQAQTQQPNQAHLQPMPAGPPTSKRLDYAQRARAVNAVLATRMPVDDKPNPVRDAFRKQRQDHK